MATISKNSNLLGRCSHCDTGGSKYYKHNNLNNYKLAVTRVSRTKRAIIRQEDSSGTGGGNTNFKNLTHGWRGSDCTLFAAYNLFLCLHLAISSDRFFKECRSISKKYELDHLIYTARKILKFNFDKLI